jgi:TldD protein
MTNHRQITDRLFFQNTGLDPAEARLALGKGLKGADDGELYLEYAQSEFFSWDDGRLKNCTYDTDMGFGMRAVSEDLYAYAHASELTKPALLRAAETVSSVRKGHGGVMAAPPIGTNQRLYTDDNPLSEVSFERKLKFLQDVDAYARSLDPRVKQVSVQLSASWKAVQIMRTDDNVAADIRPLVRFNISVYVDDGKGRMEQGYEGLGGRYMYDRLFDEKTWKHTVDQALRQAVLNLDAIAAPAGEMTVVLGAGWPGILLHEAVGHGLEGDFNRKGTSAFTDKIGQRVAAKGVTVIDDGTLPDLRGSITIDDEGTPSQRNVLIEDGILVGYLQDRMNARLMNGKPTGSGRRESYADPVLPRMTNTIMLAGKDNPTDIVSSVKKGIYAVNFGGGQVDITSGKFVFSAAEAYMIENGKVGAPIKGATLIGNGPDCLTRVSMIGNDLSLDPGVGTCGKDGQSVPVGVGQPTLRIDGLTVGGTAA